MRTWKPWNMAAECYAPRDGYKRRDGLLLADSHGCLVSSCNLRRAKPPEPRTACRQTHRQIEGAPGGRAGVRRFDFGWLDASEEVYVLAKSGPRAATATTATMANVEINLPLPVLPEGWAGEKDFKPVGSLSKTNDRKIEPVGPHFLAYARRVRRAQRPRCIERPADRALRSATSAPSPRMSASRRRPTSRASRRRTPTTSTSPRTRRCCCARPRTGSRRITTPSSA